MSFGSLIYKLSDENRSNVRRLEKLYYKLVKITASHDFNTLCIYIYRAANLKYFKIVSISVFLPLFSYF